MISEFKHLFSAISVSQGYHNFITWDKVTNTEYGYINYDMIIIRVRTNNYFSFL